MPKGVRKVTDEQKRLIRLYWQKGLTAKQIVVKVQGITEADVHNYHTGRANELRR